MSGNFIGYLIGYIIAIIGVGYAMNAAGVSEQWIIAVVLIMVGLGIVYALSRSQRDKLTSGAVRQDSHSYTSGPHQTTETRTTRTDV